MTARRTLATVPDLIPTGAVEAARIIARQAQHHRVRTLNELRALPGVRPIPLGLLNAGIDELVARGALIDGFGPHGFLWIDDRNMP